MSNDYNKITLIGRLTRDIDLKYTTTGTAIAAVSLASNRSVKKQDNWETEVSYFDGNIYGRMAENLKPYLTKGKQIAVDGYLKQDRWEKDGKTSSRVVIHANSVQLMGSSKSDGNSETNGGASRFQPRNDVPQMQNSGMPDYGSNSYSDPLSDIGDDIPF